MNLLKKISIIFVAFLAVFLDVSFFSAITTHEASIISALALAIIFSLKNKLPDLLFYLVSAVIFFTAFSSLPIWMIILIFLALPSLVFFLRVNYFPEKSIIVLISLFIIINLIFELSVMIYLKELNRSSFDSAFYFVVLNSCFGILMYVILDLIKKRFTRKELNF